MGNVFLIIREYNHLKIQPGEILQHFSARFNTVYHAIPAKIKPPLEWALLHYPNVFDPEMAFQIREIDPSTLEEMQRIEVDVETNILNREAKLRVIEKEKADQEKLISSEVELEMLTDTINKMMHILGRKEEEYKVEVGATYSKQPVPFLGKNKLSHFRARITIKICILSKITKKKMQKVVK